MLPLRSPNDKDRVMHHRRLHLSTHHALASPTSGSQPTPRPEGGGDIDPAGPPDSDPPPLVRIHGANLGDWICLELVGSAAGYICSIQSALPAMAPDCRASG
jgi:hypothetical protein